jgi:hypothetical protein
MSNEIVYFQNHTHRIIQKPPTVARFEVKTNDGWRMITYLRPSELNEIILQATDLMCELVVKVRGRGVKTD